MSEKEYIGLQKKRNNLRDNYLMSTSYYECIRLKNNIEEIDLKLTEYEKVQIN